MWIRWACKFDLIRWFNRRYLSKICLFVSHEICLVLDKIEAVNSWSHNVNLEISGLHSFIFDISFTAEFFRGIFSIHLCYVLFSLTSNHIFEWTFKLFFFCGDSQPVFVCLNFQKIKHSRNSQTFEYQFSSI